MRFAHLAFSFLFAGAAYAGHHPVMHFTPQQLQEMHAHRQMLAQRTHVLPQVANLPASVDLTQYLLTPISERDQGSCGDCWQWSNTANAEIQLSMAGGADPLSVQYINSDMVSYIPPNGSDAVGVCNGGFTSWFVDWYNTSGNSFFIPLSNTHANFSDSNGAYSDGESHTLFSNISTNPHDLFVDFSEDGALSTTSSQTGAIAAIKNALASNKPVIYSFYLCDNFVSFYNFWDKKTEADIWNPDNYNVPNSANCGYSNSYEGHSVLIVGYDANSWIVQNSWGASSTRPNGQFRLSQNVTYSHLAYANGWAVNYFETATLTWPTPVNGVCGADNGVVESVEPFSQSDLCSAGTPSTVGGTGPWTWTCAGQYGGTDASCATASKDSGGGCSASGTQLSFTGLFLLGIGLFFIRRRK